MKKFLSLLLLFGSLSVFAGNPTCRVYGSKNNAVATLERTTVSSPNINTLGTPMITGSISLTKKESEDVTVIVEAWDGNELVGTTTVTIHAGTSSPKTFQMYDSNGIEKGKTYRLAISSATCE